MRVVTPLSVAAAGLALLLLPAAVSSATKGPATGPIAFTAPGKEESIFTVNADGSGLRKLVSNAASPVWSPDLRRLAFSRPVQGEDSRGETTYGTDLYTIRPDGSNLTRVVRDGGYPAWSPDGRSMAFLRDGLWTLRLDGSPERRLVSGDIDDPTWSPDGRWIAFTRYDGTPYGVWLIRTDGTGLRRLVRGRFQADVAHPAWAPDGRRVSFVGLFENESLYIVGVDGRGLRRVARSSRANEWSPTDERILFTHQHLEREPNGLWTTRPDGRE